MRGAQVTDAKAGAAAGGPDISGLFAGPLLSNGCRLAFYALFAMPGLLLAAVYLAGALYGPKAAAVRVQTQFAKLLGAKTASAIQAMIAGAPKEPAAARLPAFGGLTFSGLAAAYDLQ
jgi:uncharacterized BrkB/YihY/UPF0761 family membrane protein